MKDKHAEIKGKCSEIQTEQEQIIKLTHELQKAKKELEEKLDVSDNSSEVDDSRRKASSRQ